MISSVKLLGRRIALASPCRHRDRVLRLFICGTAAAVVVGTMVFPFFSPTPGSARVAG